MGGFFLWPAATIFLERVGIGTHSLFPSVVIRAVDTVASTREEQQPRKYICMFHV